MAMFFIPLAGAKALRDCVPRWLAALSAVGFCATLFSCVTNAYPFVDVPNPLNFAFKLVATTALINVLGFSSIDPGWQMAPTEKTRGVKQYDAV